MQHLCEVYVGMKQDFAKYDEKLNECLNGDFTYHGCKYTDFVQFPISHGYTLDDQYQLKPAPLGGTTGGCCREKLQLTEAQLAQSWLFFGLIRCVLSTGEPSMDESKSIIHVKDLTTPKYLSTEALPGALAEWQEYLKELHREKPEKAEMRCFQAIQMLLLAKRVVGANLVDEDEGETQRTQSDAAKDRRLRDLCYMILGETLSLALAQTMRLCGINVRGWHVDEEGWGPAFLRVAQDGREQLVRTLPRAVEDPARTQRDPCYT